VGFIILNPALAPVFNLGVNEITEEFVFVLILFISLSPHVLPVIKFTLLHLTLLSGYRCK